MSTHTTRRPSFASIFAACAAAGLSLSAMAQQAVPLPAPTAVPMPQPAAQPVVATGEAPLTFQAMVHDWGRVTDDKPLEHKFHFRNSSNQTVTIDRVTATCGCTVPQLAKKVYAPGEEGEILVQFNPTNRNGPQTKNVTVHFADPTLPRIELTIHSHVLPMLWVEPNRAFFGPEVYKGVGGKQEVIITARRPGFEITSMEGATDAFTSRVIKTETVEVDGEQVQKITLEVELNKAAPIGTQNTQFTFKSNDSKWPEFKMFATAIVVGELRTDPPSAIIRTQQPNTVFESMVIVDSRNSVPFEIADVDFTVEGNIDLNMVVDYESYEHTRGRPTYLLRISGVTPPNPGQLRATIKVKAQMDGKEIEEANIILWGTVRSDQALPQLPVQAKQQQGAPNAAIPSTLDKKLPTVDTKPGSR